MVWFQCDDCGENLKKPKLQNHFRCCSASQLSCIDCGVVFTQQSVQGHTQCVSEAEKYGPKDAGCKKENAKIPAKENKSDDIDLNLGLSSKAPWSCSLCNVKATSQETLLLHSQGKKHRSKARSLTLKTTASGDFPSTIISPQTVSKDRIDASAHLAEDGLLEKNNNTVNGKAKYNEEDSALYSDKKKKLNIATKLNGNEGYAKQSINSEDGNHIEEIVYVEEKNELQRCSDDNDNGNANHDAKEGPKSKKCSRAIKWKKLIKKTLRSAPDYTMKLKKFRKSVVSLAIEALDESVDKTSLLAELDSQVESLRIVVIEGKRIRLQC